VVGALLESCIVLLNTFKYEKIKINFDLKNQALVNSFKLSLPIVLGVATNEVNRIIDQMIASLFDSGSISSLHYASKLEAMITTMLLLNIVAIIFPTLSKYVAAGQKKEVSMLYEKTVKIIIVLGIPIAAGGVILGDNIINIVFTRGAFDIEAAKLVSPLFSIYLLGSVFVTIRSATTNVFAAHGETKITMYNTVFAAIINIILNLLLGHLCGIWGLAVATSISAFVSCLHLMVASNRKFLTIKYKNICSFSVKVFLSASIMTLIICIVKSTFVHNHDMTLINNQLVCVLMCIIIGMMIYSIVLALVAPREVGYFISVFKKDNHKCEVHHK